MRQLKHERDTPKVSDFCALSKFKVYDLFFFMEKNINSIVYLDRLENFLIP